MYEEMKELLQKLREDNFDFDKEMFILAWNLEEDPEIVFELSLYKGDVPQEEVTVLH